MSTNAQIAIPTADGQFDLVYVHFDGYPSHMEKALRLVSVDDVLAAARRLRLGLRLERDRLRHHRSALLIPAGAPSPGYLFPIFANLSVDRPSHKCEGLNIERETQK